MEGQVGHVVGVEQGVLWEVDPVVEPEGLARFGGDPVGHRSVGGGVGSGVDRDCTTVVCYEIGVARLNAVSLVAVVVGMEVGAFDGSWTNRPWMAPSARAR